MNGGRPPEGSGYTLEARSASRQQCLAVPMPMRTVLSRANGSNSLMIIVGYSWPDLSRLCSRARCAPCWVSTAYWSIAPKLCIVAIDVLLLAM
jgi:hypothetical protein